MKTRSRTLLLPLVVALAGCGDYNPEDLVFRLAAPRPEDVALAPPGVEPVTNEADAASQVSQGLTACDGTPGDRNLRCHAQTIAGFLNGLTFSVLNLVDEIVELPPSHRERGRRVWGPHFDAREDATYRFEMSRSDDGGFDWCFHVAPGRVGVRAGRELSCDVAEADDFMRIVSGHLQPGDVDGGEARSGTGEIVIDLDAIARAGSQQDRGVITAVYDNRAGETDIEIALDGVGSEDVPEDAEYRYHRSADGGGTFFFTVHKEIVRGGLFEENLRENLSITAAWRADQAGRADAVITGGNLSTEEATAIQCWDEELCQVFYGDSFSNEPDEGDESACVFSGRLVVD